MFHHIGHHTEATCEALDHAAERARFLDASAVGRLPPF
jgi:hypothetical protein